MKTLSDALVQRVLKGLQKDFGERGQVSIMGEGRFTAEPKEWIPSGLRLLDLAIGNGLPVGKVIEIFGSEVTGKSALCASIIGQAQKAGAVTALMDAEEAWSRDFIKKMGKADPDLVYYFDPDTLEDMWMGVELFIDSVRKCEQERPILIVVDSLAGLPTMEEEDTPLDEATSMASGARINRKAIRKLKKKIAMERAIVVCTNHTTADPGKTWGDKTTTPGGGGPRFFSSLRIKQDHIGHILDGEKQRIGQKLESLVFKSRWDGAGKKIIYPLYFTHGIDDMESQVDFLYRRGVFGSEKGWVVWADKKMRAKDLAVLARTDAEVAAQIDKLLVEHFRGGRPAVGETDPEEVAGAV